MKFDAILFDFDGVLIESEEAGNRHLAELLTDLGHPTTPAQAMAHFTGLSGEGFLDAVRAWIGGPLPERFFEARAAEDARVVAEGVDEVVGAAAFVRSLPASLPRAIVSSSKTHWIDAHLRHLGLRDEFGPHLYSGREHVARGKPEPDLYLHGAAMLGVPIDRCVIIEDSLIGVTGAVKTGAYVIGLTAGTHCAPDHGGRLLALGADAVAGDYAEVARLLDHRMEERATA